MRTLLRTALSFLLILSPALCRAENVVVEHNFHELLTAKQMTITSGNTIGTVNDGVEYTCTGEARFGVDILGTSHISINLTGSTGVVTTTQFNNLSGIELNFYPNAVCDNIKIKLSSDGIVWGNALTEDNIEYHKSTIIATFPAGNYYVMIYNTKSTDVSILQTRFTSTTDDCNCFVYTP